jgi:hypothetical protein
VYFRLGEREGSEKLAFVEATERAWFLCHDYESATDS